ncbi:hypothetical protein AAHH78_35195, partial [Burkholderia pseudomallei]
HAFLPNPRQQPVNKQIGQRRPQLPVKLKQPQFPKLNNKQLQQKQKSKNKKPTIQRSLLDNTIEKKKPKTPLY